MKKWVVVASLLVFVGVLVAYWLANQPRPRLDQEEASFSISAAGLAAQYADDEASADEKYLGQVLEVYGPVAEVIKEENGTAILLDGGSEGMVYCALAEWSEELSTGQVVTVKGRCSGYLMDVILNDCILLKN